MNGPQHYKEAERLLAYSTGVDGEFAPLIVAQAQVHATLALAAATANESCTCGLYEQHDESCAANGWREATS